MKNARRTDDELEINKKIGERIRKLRRSFNLTQAHMAETLELSLQMYFRYERGLSSLSAAKIVQISEVFGVSTDDLLTGEPRLDSLKARLKSAVRMLLRCQDEETLERFADLAEHIAAKELENDLNRKEEWSDLYSSRGDDGPAADAKVDHEGNSGSAESNQASGA